MNTNLTSLIFAKKITARNIILDALIYDFNVSEHTKIALPFLYKKNKKSANFDHAKLLIQ